VNTEPDDDPEVEFYEPQHVGLSEDDCIIFDPVEFGERFNAIAVQFKGGDLWILDRDSFEWAKVEPKKPNKPRALKTVQ
jgi:hypothetical protein